MQGRFEHEKRSETIAAFAAKYPRCLAPCPPFAKGRRAARSVAEGSAIAGLCAVATKFADTSNPPPPAAAPPLLREDTGLPAGTNWHESTCPYPSGGYRVLKVREPLGNASIAKIDAAVSTRAASPA